jgi:hypothetical protein
MNRSTAIGRLFRMDQQAGRAEFIRALRRQHGRILHTATDIGLGWRHVIEIIWREGLWDTVDQIRAENRDHIVYEDEEWLMKTRAALGVPHVRPRHKRRGARPNNWG